MSAADTEAGQGLQSETEATTASATDDPYAVHAPRVEEAGTQKRKPLVPPGLILLIVVLAAAAGLFALVSARKGSSAASVPFQDLGAGISNPTGLKGNLQARWQGGAAQYQLKLLPMNPRQSAGFSFVAANPPAPLFIHVKLLDRTGFTLCSKDVFFPSDPASPGEQKREHGHDVFQDTTGDDGKIAAVNAQGTLPCTPDQYKQVVYWDFSTNFPTLAGQDELMNRVSLLKARQKAAARAVLQRKNSQKSAFYSEGDDRVTGYDASRSVLQTRLGRNFFVSRSGEQLVASQWAANSALFHYKCDQRSRCLLTHAGGRESLSGMLQQ